MRFRAPPAYEVREIHSPGALPAPYGPPPGFLTLLTAYALPDPAGLVSCRRRSWGFCPPELFPPNEAVAPLDARNRPGVDCTPHAAFGRGRGSSRHPRCRVQSPSRLPASSRRAARLHGLAPRRSPSPAARGLAERQARCSPGVPPLQGLAPTGPGPAVASQPPLMGFARADLAFAASSVDLVGEPALQSLTRAGGRCAGSHRGIYPPEVSNLVSPLRNSKTEPHLAHGFTSDPGARRRVLRIFFGAVGPSAGAP